MDWTEKNKKAPVFTEAFMESNCAYNWAIY